MLINLDNRTWVNKNHIVTVYVENRVKKADFIDYVSYDDELDARSTPWYENRHVHYGIIIGKEITIKFLENKAESIFVPIDKIVIDDLELGVDTVEKFLALCKGTKELQAREYSYSLTVDNEFMEHFNKLLKDDYRTNELGLKHCLEEYLTAKETDKQVERVKEKLIEKIKNNYLGWKRDFS